MKGGGCLVSVGALAAVSPGVDWFAWEAKMTLREAQADPVAGMYGPIFLVVYGAFIATTTLLCRRWTRAGDQSNVLPPMDIPREVDPFEVAYLRGGEHELLRVIVFSLVERGFLSVEAANASARDAKTDSVIHRAPNPPDLSELSPLELRVFGWLVTPSQVSRLFKARILSPDRDDVAGRAPWWAEEKEAIRTVRRFREVAESADLLWPHYRFRFAVGPFAAGAGAIALLGGYKLVNALERGHSNVGFLVLMGLGGAIILATQCTPSRLTARGRQLVRDLRQTLEPGIRLVKQNDGTLEAPTLGILPATGDGRLGDPLLLLVGVFGLPVLSGTPWSSLNDAFRHAAASGAGGCGACGGCGGCGGCGCGCGGCA